ncbi:EAL domain-containing protein [Rhodoferax sp.]|uniref:EAL domain-containing protein n=1 Tax=Rhodoferax sp. TaxID=50421 RepID=UPI002617D549|nr:EAL domain-containing protein [Rhodoferax sp.]MDD2924466.1 EAL domain-containing protein [Rhodoferax sp.]
MLWVLGLALLLAAWPSHALDTVKIAVLAFRPKAQTLAQWQPLVKVLKASVPDYDFEVRAYTLAEMEAVVARQEVEFVLTNPGHYVKLARLTDLKAPLATLLVNESGVEVAGFGGVMFTRSDRPEPVSLSELKNMTMAAVGSDSLGGYQMQAFELLRVGVVLNASSKLMFTGVPQDRVVAAVLQGKADVGFVRTGLLEAMQREGKLDLAQVRVLNAQQLTGFPVLSSTPLYPEWPFSYLGHVDEHLARRVTAALFSIQADSASAQAMGIRGFSVPDDYSRVADVLRALRMPPFDVEPAFTLRDVVLRYRTELMGAGVALLLILLLGARLWMTGQQLRSRQNQVLRQRQALAESEFRWKFAVEASGGGLWDWNIPAGTLFLSESWKATLGYQDHELGQNTNEWESRLHPDDRASTLAALNQCLRGETPRYRHENRVRCKDGSYKWMLEQGQIVSRDAHGKALRMIGIDTDITERRQTEDQLRLAASVFEHAREGICITDADANIVDANAAFATITGYRREEVLGRNPRILSSGRQSHEFYQAMFAELKSVGHWQGELWNRRKDGEVYAELLTISAVRDAAQSVQHYVAMFFDITANKEHQQQLEHIAHFDALTNLPNRVLLADRLKQAMAQAQRRGQLVAVAYLDLDGFKQINDTYGHEAGDQLLVGVAGNMRNALREGDTLARLGGDEFVAVLADLSDANDCAGTLKRLLAAAALSMPFGDVRLQVSASLGVTFYPQAEPVDADQLMRQADQAMYQAKVSGKNRYHAFDAAHDRSVRGLHESLDEIARALEHAEFELYYQPKVNLQTGVVIGAEALIRWQHPTKGRLSPADFLPVVEDHALAVSLGEWVIRAALTQMQQWQAQGLVFQVSVNVGARQLQEENFVQRLAEMLARFPGVDTTLLQLEVLETSALHDLERTARVIHDCQQLGVGFALDDFGTGYSSLTYLKYLPVEVIKIDQSFVRGMLADADDLAIMEGVIGLARAFKRQVIAEGVETVAHGTLLLRLGCHLAQGYGIARPMPASELPGWLASWHPDPAWAGVAPTSLP